MTWLAHQRFWNKTTFNLMTTITLDNYMTYDKLLKAIIESSQQFSKHLRN